MTRVALLAGSLASWLFSVSLSLVASPSYVVPVSLALVFAALHFWLGYLCLGSLSTRWRYLMVVPALILVVLTVDNLGRFSYSLGGPLFRLLI